MQGLADDKAGKKGVHEHGSVAVIPIAGDEARGAGSLSNSFSRVRVFVRLAANVHEPSEQVADRAFLGRPLFR